MTRSLRLMLFLAALVVLAVVTGLSVSRYGRRPVLESLDRTRAVPGEAIVLRGRWFGDTGDGRVVMDDRELTASHVVAWRDDEIEIRLPPFDVSALIRVTTPRGTSDSLMIRNAPWPTTSVVTSQ